MDFIDWLGSDELTADVANTIRVQIERWPSDLDPDVDWHDIAAAVLRIIVKRLVEQPANHETNE